MSPQSPLKWKPIAPFAALFLLAFLPMSFSYVHTERAALMARLYTKAESQARNLAEIVGDDMAMGQYDGVQRIVDAAAHSDKDIAYLTILGQDGFVYASSEKTLLRQILARDDFEKAALKESRFTLRSTPDPSVFEAVMPVRFQSYAVGVLRLGVSTGIVNALIRKSIQTLLVLASFSLIFAFLAYRLREKTHELALANARLADLDRAKSEFLGVVSHELRTPLTSINGFLRTILERGEQVTQAKRLEYLKIMQREATRLIALVNDLLDITNIELGHYQLERASTDVSALANGVVDSMLALHPQANVVLKGCDEPRLIDVDGDKLKQVFINLLNNAIKYSPPSAQVIVEVRQERDGVEISVTDSGPGIDARYMEHLFEKFYRVPQDMPDPGPKGSGLGLAISKKIVELHGGAITVRSAVGEGSRFEFWVPCSGIS